MKIIPCNPGEPELSVIDAAVEVLRNGGIVAHPTDTCYGLAVDIMHPQALGRLYEKKAMSPSKPVSILVRSFEEAETYGIFSEMARRLAREFWPGPLTLVVPRTSRVPDFLNPGHDGIGLRVIVDPVANALMKGLGGPVTTTSANTHGSPSPYSVEDISMEPDLIVDAGALVRREKPSTVLKVYGSDAVTLRQGGLYLEI